MSAALLIALAAAGGVALAAWPVVRVVVPARDEAEVLPATLPALLALAVLGLALLFALPPALVPLGIAAAAVALPSGRFFGLAPGWALAFPLAGALYGGMTLDSGRRHLLGRRRAW